MGAVAQTDMAIINEAHARGFIVPDKVRGASKNNQAAGAYVATPKKGMHKWIGSIDLNSLYPSILRSLNMSTETIVGQVRHTFTDTMIEENNGEIAKKLLHPKSNIKKIYHIILNNNLKLNDLNKIKKKLKWYPKTNFSKGIKLTLNWYFENKSYYKSLSKKDIINRLGKV